MIISDVLWWSTGFDVNTTQQTDNYATNELAVKLFEHSNSDTLLRIAFDQPKFHILFAYSNFCSKSGFGFECCLHTTNHITSD